MSKVCCVCNEPKESKDNVIFACKGQGCDVSVHQGCYGIVNVPSSGQWFCRKCESQERAARVRCELCPIKEGALKRTDSGGWAHVACALYIPEVVFGNNRIMEPIITSKLPKERFSKSCYICEERGNETQAMYGACMSCHKPSCRQAFHVTCAQRERLLCEEEDPRDSRNVIYCGYCSTHHKKMLRQKLKQAHKPFYPPSTSGSSLYPAMPTSSSPSSTTPLSSLSNLASSEGGMVRDGRKLERTRSGSPLKVKQERESLTELPIKRSSTDSSSTNTAKTKRRRRKPSSSNESTTSEAPSNSSDLSLLPSSLVIPTSSPRLAPGLPLSSPMVTAVKGHLDGGRGQKPRGAVREILDNFAASAMVISRDGEVLGDSERRVTTTSSSSSGDQNSRIQGPPPRSLQELLERQWEQTAQFILDQAGKQNSGEQAGSMLAHLHTLQSENRQMQSRIMELASQREFYIAINTKLRQTLTEHELGHLPNGVQPVGNGLQVIVSGRGGEEVGGGETIVPMDTVELKPRLSGSDHTHQRGLHPSSREVESAPPHYYTRNTPPALSKDEDTFLHAHYPTIGANQSQSADSRDKEATPSSLRHSHTGEVPPASSDFIPTLTQISMATSQYPPPLDDVTPLPHSHAPIMEYHNHPSQQDPTAPLHEVTQVTNSVHAPISSLTPLPNDGSEGYGGGVANMTTPSHYKKEFNRR